MAKKSAIQQYSYISEMTKVGKPRTSKIFRKKGNRPARTSSKGNGKRIK